MFGAVHRSAQGLEGQVAVYGREHLLRGQQPRLRAAQPDHGVGHPGQRARVAAAAYALYADVEHYDRTDATCRTAVRRYVSAWTRRCTLRAYLAGVYVHQDSGLRDLAGTYNSTTYARPDAVWMARWDGKKSLTGWPTAPNSYWAYWQRAKQYRGDHNETWGGVTINIDSDVIKGPVATVARTYKVTSSTALNARTGPGTSYPVTGSALPRGALAYVMCQKAGSKVGTTAVWNKLVDGRWVSDYYVSNRSNTTWSSPVPRCP